MALGDALETVVQNGALAIGKIQVGINKVLWGNGKAVSNTTANFNQQTGTVQTSSTRKKFPQQIKSFFESGLFNALDVIGQIDLCNVLTYLLDNINIKGGKRPPEPWTAAQKAFFFTQDLAFEVQKAIDKYTANPGILISNYLGEVLEPITNQQASTNSGTPEGYSDISGIAVQKYNVYALIKQVTDLLNTNPLLNAEAFNSEERDLLRQVPGLVGNINILKDVTKFFDKFNDYTSISNEDLIKINKKIDTLRSICVVIQTLNFQSAIALAGNFLGKDVRKDIQKLSQFMNPLEIMKVLKQINNSLQAFIKMARKIQGVISQAQFIIKIAILIIKVFKFIQVFFQTLALPGMFTTSGVQTSLSKANQAANDTSNKLIKLLNQINALLGVVLSFVRYLIVNTNELIIRLEVMIASLEGCEAVKESDVIEQLKVTLQELRDLNVELETYVEQYDTKTKSDQAQFGKYEIRIIEEQTTDPSITNRRRRGVALDVSGVIVVESDLTFATDNAVIIGEVKQKLVAAGLVLPSLATLDNSDLAVISESIDFLNENDVLSDDLEIEGQFGLDNPDNMDENQGIGLNAFINNLKGGKKLRQRVRASLDNASANLAEKIGNEGRTAKSAVNTSRGVASSVGGNEPEQQEPTQGTGNPRKRG